MKVGMRALLSFALHMSTTGAIPSAFGARNIGDCHGGTGFCKPKSECWNDGWRNLMLDNECPDHPEDIKCCIAPDNCDPKAEDSYCTWNNDNGKWCFGEGSYFKPGLCPGPSGYQCCTYDP